MTQIIDDKGSVVPVTAVQAGPCQVTKIEDGVVVLGYEPRKAKKGFYFERGTKMAEPDKKVNDEVTIDSFEGGDLVTISAMPKGRGFAGVVKRHNFSGGPKSHGHRHVLRRPGSIGSRFPQKVKKGRRMAGRMGGEQVTVSQVRVVKVIKDENLVLLKGQVPGAPGNYVKIVG